MACTRKEEMGSIEMESFSDARDLYEVERRVRHGERPGFRISELQISPTQKVPWHFHNSVQDTRGLPDQQCYLIVTRRNAPKFEIAQRYDVAEVATWAMPVFLGTEMLVRDASGVSRLTAGN